MAPNKRGLPAAKNPTAPRCPMRVMSVSDKDAQILGLYPKDSGGAPAPAAQTPQAAPAGALQNACNKARALILRAHRALCAFARDTLAPACKKIPPKCQKARADFRRFVSEMLRIPATNVLAIRVFCGLILSNLILVVLILLLFAAILG